MSITDGWVHFFNYEQPNGLFIRTKAAMKTILAIYLFIHGFAHLVGFLVYWRFLKEKNVKYKTTLFPGNMEIGEDGIRLIGFFYLLTAFGFGYVGYELLTDGLLWSQFIWYAIVVSIILCITGLPDTRYGILANVILIIFLALNFSYYWIA